MTELTQDVVARLLNDPSPLARAETAAKVSAVFAQHDLRPNERALAEELFRIMLHDTDVSVRRALSENLKDNPEVPRDVALGLARDVEEVAVPMLHFSLVFTDDDLIEILRTRPLACQLAVARRAAVSPTVSDALAETRSEEVVTALAQNPGAEIANETYGKVIDMFSGNEVVMDSLAERPTLPVKYAERLIALVSANLRIHLATHPGLSPDLADRLIIESREKATVALVSAEAPDVELSEFVRHLHAKGRLTGTIVVRALCVGDFPFFEAAMAFHAKISVDNARLLVRDSGGLGLESLCNATAVPEAIYEVARIAVDVAQQTEYSGGREGRDTYQRRLVERFGGSGEGLDPDDLESLLVRLANAGSQKLEQASSMPKRARR
ncbi:MAG: DUF2336 domain-containing protein [Proteobacteria bacterium]|nr:DUF2336 domain-containing protein [Pseudomonadota bacterium]